MATATEKATERLDEPIRRRSAAAALGMTRQGLHCWIDRFVTQRLRQAGLCLPSTISLKQVWALAIGRWIRSSGESFETSSAVYRFLENLPSAEIDKSFARGATCLYIVSGTLLPRLITREAIGSAEVKQLEIESARLGLHPKVLRIDTKPLLHVLSELVEDDSA